MLSESARGILGLIAEGRGYDQILQQHPELTYFDIFAAAREALELAQAASSAPTPEGVAPLGARADFDDGPVSTQPKRLPAYIERARATYRRAWARWTHEEDAQLTALFQQGDSRSDMVQALGRQPGAIRNRLLKLGLISETDDGDGPARDLGPGEAAQLPDPSLGPADRGGRPEREPASPLVAGWESFRQRLSEDSGTT
jgi:hypothetical protein